MSWKVQALVGERVCGSITRKMVLLNMASRANDDGTGVYASLTMIAGWCEVDARTVRRIVRDLEADGLIIQCGWKEVKNGLINEWRVAVEEVEKLPLYKDEVAAKRSAKIAKSATPDTVSGVRKTPKKTVYCKGTPGHSVRPDIKSPRTHDPQTPDTVSASSILEPSSSSEAKAPEELGAVLPFEIRAGDGSDAIAEYNAAASRRNWIAARGQPNVKRKQAIRSRLRECGGLPGWREQLLLAEQASFLGGDNERGWRMDLDFFTSPRGWSAILEGKYTRSKPSISKAGPRNGIRPNPYIRSARQ